MNKQKPGGIEWLKTVNPDGTVDYGYTWNVGGGCFHDCQWRMPDDSLVECYAKTISDRMRFYPEGFRHAYWHPDRLDEPVKLKKPTKIFLDSMNDLMGHWVSNEQVEQVLDVCRQATWHKFILLTKNPGRLERFRYPPNVWVGVSMPATFMNGHELSLRQQERWLEIALESLSAVEAKIRWMSFEPLSWDCADVVDHAPIDLDWAVIGAASRGRQYYQPDPKWVDRLTTVLDDRYCKVFFKGNLRNCPAAIPWREEFPE